MDIKQSDISGSLPLPGLPVPKPRTQPSATMSSFVGKSQSGVQTKSPAKEQAKSQLKGAKGQAGAKSSYIARDGKKIPSPGTPGAPKRPDERDTRRDGKKIPSPAGPKGNTTHKREKPEGSAPFNKNGHGGAVQNGLNEYKMTQLYVKAVEKGFQSQTALDKFNEHMSHHADSVDPKAYPVCEWCGSCDLKLCNDFVNGANSAVVLADEAIYVPMGAPNTTWRFMWVDRVRRMFTRPSYNPTTALNHNIGWLSNGDLPEREMLLPDLLAYMRLYQNTSYSMNGVIDRKAKLAHSKKLAARYLDEKKVPLIDRLNSEFVARLNYTVQKATDCPDDDFLFKENEERHNISSFFRAPAIPVRTLIIAGAILSPVLVSKLVGAKMSLTLLIFRRLFHTNALILVNGSIQVLKSAIRCCWIFARVLSERTWSGLVTPCSSAIRQLSCNTVPTTSMTASFIDTLNRRLIPAISTGVSSIASWSGWQPELPNIMFLSAVLTFYLTRRGA